MQLTKYTHACVRLTAGDRTLTIDPGIWAEDAAFVDTSHILLTHEHFDHVDADRLLKAQRAAPDLTIYAPAPIGTQLTEAGLTVENVEVGDEFDAAGFAVRAVGGLHAEIYDGMPGCANVGYVIDGSIYHPGDSLYVPDTRIETLLVPVSAPWLKLAEAIEFLRAVRPARAFPIHDAMLSDKGLAGTDNWLRMKGETDYARIVDGESIAL